MVKVKETALDYVIRMKIERFIFMNGVEVIRFFREKYVSLGLCDISHLTRSVVCL